MQKATRIIALLLVALAVVLAIVAFTMNRRALKPAPAVPVGSTIAPTVNTPDTTAKGPVVVVATQALPAGKPIDMASLRTASTAKAVEGSFRTPEEIDGAVPLIDIPAGTPLTTQLLARGLAMQLQPGERALAVPVDELAGAGNRILPGDYVDVFLSLKASPRSLSGKPEPAQARLLLPRVRVLAYGSKDLPVPLRPDGTDPAGKPSQGNPPAPRSAVLAVPLELASRLLLATQNGSLSLALRHPDDDGLPDSELFPQPRRALAALATRDPAQKQQLDSADNRAFAGIDGEGLAGLASERPASSGQTSHPVRTPALEIIRGSSRNQQRPTP